MNATVMMFEAPHSMHDSKLLSKALSHESFNSLITILLEKYPETTALRVPLKIANPPLSKCY
jgi:hypothetical protein